MSPVDQLARIEIRTGREPHVQREARDLAAAVRGKGLAEALALMPLLLPVCGAAHVRAAELAAGLGDVEGSADSVALERQRALLWRFAIDWPQALGEVPQAEIVRAGRGSESADELERLLATLLPDFAAVASSNDLLTWAREGASLAARLLARVFDLDAQPTGAVVLPQYRLDALARRLIAADAFDAAALALPEPVEVGPIAWVEDPVLAALIEERGVCTLTRLAAQLLDSRTARRDGFVPAAPVANAGDLSIASAMTSRGPLYHGLRLDAAGRIDDWRVLAPTDWYFAPAGAFVKTLDVEPGMNVDVRLAVLGCDPCAAWTIEGPPGAQTVTEVPGHA